MPCAGWAMQDTNYYTSIPTSQVYYNPLTGARTAVIFNPAARPKPPRFTATALPSTR
jgi:hypothetical protein